MDLANKTTRNVSLTDSARSLFPPSDLENRLALSAIDDVVLPVAMHGTQAEKMAALELVWAGGQLHGSALAFGHQYRLARQNIIPEWEKAAAEKLQKQIDRRTADSLVASLNLPHYLQQQYDRLSVSCEPGSSKAGKMHAWLRQVGQGLDFLQQTPTTTSLDALEKLGMLWQNDLTIRVVDGVPDFTLKFVQARRHALHRDAILSHRPQLSSYDFALGVKRVLVSQLPPSFQDAYDRIDRRKDLTYSTKRDKILRLIMRHEMEMNCQNDQPGEDKSGAPVQASTPVVQARATPAQNGLQLLVASFKRKAASMAQTFKVQAPQPAVSAAEQEFKTHFDNLMAYIDAGVKSEARLPAKIQAACAWFANADAGQPRGWALDHEPVQGFAERAIAAELEELGGARADLMAQRVRLLAAVANFGATHNLGQLAGRYLTALDGIGRPE